MAEKLIIVMANTDPRNGEELGAPIFLDKTEVPTIGWMAILGDPGGNRIGVMQRMPAP